MTIKKIVFSLFLCFTCGLYVFADDAEQVQKWQQISGNWSIRLDGGESCLIEPGSRPYNWGMSELINQNSVITLASFEQTKLVYTLQLNNDKKDPAASALLFFGAQNYRTFYAFRFTGGVDCIKKVSLISCAIKDTTLPPSARGNFLITELGTADIQFDYAKRADCEIRINGKEVALFIDGKKVITAETPEAVKNGSIGFSAKGMAIRISHVKAYAKSSTVFEDDFSSDSIKKAVIKATIEQKKK